MYWPTGSARRLCVEPAGLPDVHNDAVHMASTRDGMLWFVLTRTALLLWRARPIEIVASVIRTQRSLHEYGANVHAVWSPDASGIAIQTERDTLLFYELSQPASKPSMHALFDPSAPELAPSSQALLATFQPATGDAYHTCTNEPLSARINFQLLFRDALQVDPGIACIACVDAHLFVSTKSPAAVQLVSWPSSSSSASTSAASASVSASSAASAPPILLAHLPWLQVPLSSSSSLALTPSPIVHAEHSYATDLSAWISADGSAYIVGRNDTWVGACAYRAVDSAHKNVPTTTALNARFSLLALGFENGHITLFEFQTATQTPQFVHSLTLPHITGRVICLDWTADGHALAVGYEHGWAIWSTFGHVMCHSFREDWTTATRTYRDSFQFGVQSVFWGLGGTELFVLARPLSPDAHAQDDERTLAYVVPFVKAAATTHMTPADVNAGFLLGDASAYMYRGLEQSDAGLLSPGNDVWRHIPFPAEYLTTQWPIRCTALSPDGRFLAIAGRRGLAHYSTASGHWKLYEVATQALSFCVRGGMAWYQHVLIAACDCMGEIQIRLYSRDQPLDNAHLLDLVVLGAPVVTLALFETSLLLYLADNTLVHYLITPTREHIRLRLCGSISFDGIIGEPSRVRALSWLVPPVQRDIGHPADDLTVANLLFLIDGMLVLLRPARASDDDQLSYDLQVLHEHIESFCTPIYTPGALSHSLWAFDGHHMSVWLHPMSRSDAPDCVLPVSSTYPLCILSDRGILLGAESLPVLRRTLDTTSYRLRLHTTLFLDHVLRAILERRHLLDAIEIASLYVPLEYFSHALEVLVHAVLEDEADAAPQQGNHPGDLTSPGNGITDSVAAGTASSAATYAGTRAPILPTVLAFLDHFDEALQVVVRAARKTEMSRWRYLFDAAGRPSTLMQHCLDRHDYASASAYLLIVHELEDGATSLQATAKALARFEEAGEFALLRDTLSFLHGLDENGDILRTCTSAASELVQSSGISILSREYDVEVERRMQGAQAVPLLRTSLSPSLSRQAPSPRKLGLTDSPRRPTSVARKSSMSNSPALRTSSAHVLHRAARSASITLSPSMPRMQANGRLVLPPTSSPGLSPRVP